MIAPDAPKKPREGTGPKKPRKKPGASPTKLSLGLLRERGYRCAIVEHWNPFAHIRQDLFGFIDILAIRKGEVLGVQSTSDDNVSKRLHKIADAEAVGDVREAGISIHVHGWKKKDGRWVLREVNAS